MTKPSSTQSRPVFRLRELITPILPLWLLSWLLGVVLVVSVLGLLMVSGWFITLSALMGLVASGSHAFNYLAPSAWIRSFAIARTAARYGDLMVSHQAIFELLKGLRLRFFRAFARLDTPTRQQFGASTVQHRLVKDIDTLDEFVLRFISPWVLALAALLVLKLALIAVMGVDAALVLLPLGAVLLLALLALRWAKPLAQAQSELSQARKQLLLTRLPALTQLLTWGQWRQQLQVLAQRDASLNAVHQRHHHIRRVTLLLMQWAVGAALLVLLALGASGIMQLSGAGMVGAAMLLALCLGLLGAMEFLLPLGSEPMALSRSQSARDNLNALLGYSKDTTKAPLPSDFALVAQDLTVKQPSAVFGAAGLNFRVEKGVPLLIMGVSGGGKSTLLDTIAGELLPHAGSLQALSADGQALDWQAIDWQGQLGYLGQRVDIFDQTLADNLRLGRGDASDEELLSVLAQVGLKDWAQAQPQGLDTRLGEYGMAVSGGQARRIALARLLLSPKKVLLLDEPFAGLDDATRHALWQTLKQRQAQGLLVIVTHHQWDFMAEVGAINQSDEVAYLSLGAPTVV